MQNNLSGDRYVAMITYAFEKSAYAAKTIINCYFPWNFKSSMVVDAELMLLDKWH